MPKRKRDQAYTGGNLNSRKKPSNNLQGSENLLHSRANTKNVINGLEQKRTILVSKKGLPHLNNQNENAFETNFLSELESVPSHRPCFEITEYNENGSPAKVKTPGKNGIGGTELTLEEKIFPLYIFSNNADAISPNDRDAKAQFPSKRALRAFQRSQAGQALQEISQSYKFESVTFSNELILKTRKEKAKNNNKRVKSQNAVVANTGVNAKEASATKYAEATQLFNIPIAWEHTHLVAYSILGPLSQNVDNLVVATNHANTNMMFIESRIPELAKEWTLQLEVKAHLIPGTHIATKIEYSISGVHNTTKDTWSLPLVFDAQTPNKPHISYGDYMKKIIKCLTTQKSSNAVNLSKQISTSKVLFENQPATDNSSPPSKKQKTIR